MKYTLVSTAKEFDDKGKEIEKISDENTLISGNDKYGDVSIKDLAEHQVLIDKQIEAIQNDENYKNKEEIKELEKEKDEEYKTAKDIIAKTGIEIDFDLLIESYRGE